jgi:hypothetical protein
MKRVITSLIKLSVIVVASLLPLGSLIIRNVYGTLLINSVTANPIEAHVGQEVFVETSITLAC